ncbi:MAG: hypothetical protein WDN00_13065 [Limisphaerales bacterium]
MKKIPILLTALTLLNGINQTIAQGTKFFRISGPATTTITTFQPDGSIIWTNALPGTNYTVQTVSFCRAEPIGWIMSSFPSPATSAPTCSLLSIRPLAWP